MRRALLIPFIAVIATACAAVAPTPSGTVPLPELVSGAALFGEPVTPTADESGEILELDEPMKAFVRKHVGKSNNDSLNLQRLVAGMREAGLLDLGYDSVATLTAAEVFRQKRGNCLSATNLFVALARYAGLDVQFQDVDIPPVWIADSGYVMLDQHVNAAVRDVWRSDPRRSTDYVMDFNQPEAQGHFELNPVEDNHAFALFYNNLAVDYLRAGNLREAVAHIARAIALEPRSVASWVNLGALYSKQKHYEHAISAYTEAIRIEPSNKPALSNLANLYAYLGDEARAAQYRQAVTYYQSHNPYYQYAVARDAYQRGVYTDALRAIDRAIRLKRDDHQFHFLRGTVLVQLGELNRARDSLAKAREYAPYDAKQRYAAKLDALATLSTRTAPPPDTRD